MTSTSLWEATTVNSSQWNSTWPNWTTSETLLSSHTSTRERCEERSLAQMVVRCWGASVLCLLGCVGNAVCVLVFLKQRYGSVAKPLLLALCCTDILFLLLVLLLAFPCLLCKLDADKGRNLQVVLTPQARVLHDVMRHMTLVVTLAIGVERTVAVTRPLKLRAVCTKPRARSVVLALYMFILALNAPAFFLYNVHERVTDDNVTQEVVTRTWFYAENSYALDFYLQYFLLVAQQGLPCLAIFVCFVVILVSIKRRLHVSLSKAPKFGAFPVTARGRRGHRPESDHGDLVLEERKLTRALLVVLFLALVSHVSALVIDVYHLVWPGDQSLAFLLARDVGYLLMAVNSAINFVVFMGVYKHFSVTFKTLAGLCD